MHIALDPSMTTPDSAFIDRLIALLGPQGVLSGPDVLTRSVGTFRPEGITAIAIARPATTAQVADVMKLCHETGRAVVTHGGRTGLVGGGDSAPAELVLSLERMNRIEGIDEIGRTATVEAGVVLQRLQEAADGAGLYYPVDFGARGSATIGGSIATNAGGNRVIRYGMTRASVLGLEAVLADGTIVTSMSAMLKNNAGYDLKQLFIGSEGTLGIVTRAVLRLHEKPRSQQTALVACANFTSLTALLKHMDSQLGGQLAAFEVMWQDYFDLATSPPARSSSPFSKRHPYYVLIETLGADEVADADRLMSALESAADAGWVTDASIAQSIDQRNALWRIRDSVEEMFRFGPLHSYDVSLPITAMQAYVEHVQRGAAALWPEGRCWVFGHMGDGNLHVSIAPCVDRADGANQGVVSDAGPSPGDDTHAAADALVYGPLTAVNGSVSAEHGIGSEKKAWLHACRSPAEMDLMRLLKRSLDPKNLLNPGKVI